MIEAAAVCNPSIYEEAASISRTWASNTQRSCSATQERAPGLWLAIQRGASGPGAAAERVRSSLVLKQYCLILPLGKNGAGIWQVREADLASAADVWAISAQASTFGDGLRARNSSGSSSGTNIAPMRSCLGLSSLNGWPTVHWVREATTRRRSGKSTSIAAWSIVDAFGAPQTRVSN